MDILCIYDKEVCKCSFSENYKDKCVLEHGEPCENISLEEPKEKCPYGDMAMCDNPSSENFGTEISDYFCEKCISE